MSMLGGFHPIPTAMNLEEHSRTPLARLRVLRRRRAVLALVCGVVTAVAALLIAVAPLLAVTVFVLLAVITATLVNFVIATTSVLRLSNEIRARRYEDRFPHVEE